MVSCSVLGCKSRSERKQENITFHTFPNDSCIKKSWIAVMGRSNWAPTKYSYVCSIHFEEACFRKMDKRTILRKGSIPTLFIHGPQNTDLLQSCTCSCHAQALKLMETKSTQTVDISKLSPNPTISPVPIKLKEFWREPVTERLVDTELSLLKYLSTLPSQTELHWSVACSVRWIRGPSNSCPAKRAPIIESIDEDGTSDDNEAGNSGIGELIVKNELIEPLSLRMLEVCVDSLQSALNAIHGGADELELCSSLTEGGLTPSVGLVNKVMSIVNKIPSTEPLYKTCTQSCNCCNLFQKPKVNVMIRCRTGSDFCYSEPEMDTMMADIEAFKKLDVDRFVFGCLTKNQEVDKDNCFKVIKMTFPKPVTFHRAFDVCSDSMAAMVDIIDLGFDRVLTSGQSNSAGDEKGMELIKTLLTHYSDAIDIMPGAGVNKNNVKYFIEMGCKIVHSSCKTKMCIPKLENKLCMGTNDSECIYVTDESIVKMTKKMMNNCVV